LKGSLRDPSHTARPQPWSSRRQLWRRPSSYSSRFGYICDGLAGVRERTLMLLGDGNWTPIIGGRSGETQSGEASAGSDRTLYVLTTLTDAEGSGLRLGFPAKQHLFSLCEPPQAMCTHSRNPLATDAGHDQLELPHANFSPLVQVLAEEKGKSGGAGRQPRRRNSRGSSICSRRSGSGTSWRGCWRTTRSSAGLLEVKLVVPSLQRFSQKMREKEFSKCECERRCCVVNAQLLLSTSR